MKALAGTLILALLLSSCARTDRIVIGSKNFTEQVLLGELRFGPEIEHGGRRRGRLAVGGIRGHRTNMTPVTDAVN